MDFRNKITNFTKVKTIFCVIKRLFEGALLGVVMLGLLIGGFFLKKVKAQLRGFLLFLALSNMFDFISITANMFAVCPTVPLAGQASPSTGLVYDKFIICFNNPSHY